MSGNKNKNKMISFCGNAAWEAKFDKKLFKILAGIMVDKLKNFGCT